MYKIELLIVNPIQNLFVTDVCLTTKEEKFYVYDQIFQATKKCWSTKRPSSVKQSVTQLENGAFRQQVLYSYFDTIKDAEELCDIRANFDHPYRKLEKQFVIENKLLTEINILNEDNSIVKTIHSCRNDTCLRYGNCKSVAQGGCFSDIKTISLNFPRHFHIKEVSNFN